METLTSFLLSAAIAILLPFFAAQYDIASDNGNNAMGGKGSRPHNGVAAQSSDDSPLPALLSSVLALEPAATVVVGGTLSTVSANSYIGTAQAFLSTANTASTSALAADTSSSAAQSSSSPTTTLPTAAAASTPSTTGVPASATTFSTQPSNTLSPSSTTAAAAATAAAVQSVLPSVSSSSSSSNRLAIGLGAGLGVPLAALLLAGLIFFLLRRRRQRASRAGIPVAASPEPVAEKEIPSPRHGVSELGNDGQILEASSVPDPVELSTVQYPGWVEPRKGTVEIG